MKKLLIGIAIITFLSCEQPATSPQDSDCIEISFNNAKSVNFLDAFEIVKVVPLQTIEKSLITRISKIIIHDGDFFLFNTNMNDPVFKEVLQFDSTGQFISKLTSSRSAVTDFRYASDFLIEDGSIYFLEGVVKRILISDDDKITAAIPLATDGHKFIRQSDKFWVYRDNYFESLSVQDSKLKNSNLAILSFFGNFLPFSLSHGIIKLILLLLQG